jgi:ABC-type phosphate/phosphonate transport system ATPase subunit
MLPVPAVYAKFPDRIVSLAPSTTEILRLLRELKDGKNISIIMALHDINIALKFDKVMLISVCL